jgi:hypothetical protein
VRGKPTGDNTVSKYPPTMPVFEFRRLKIMPYLHSFVIVVWFHSPEFHKSQEDAAKTCTMVPAWDPDGVEDSSSSVYFCGVSKSREDTTEKPVVVPVWDPDAEEDSSSSVYSFSVSTSREDSLEKLIMVLSWNLDEGVPLPQSISVVSSSLQRMLLGKLSWSHHGI